MLGQPALLARHDAGNAQSKTFFAQQRIAAVARAKRPDEFFVGEMTDVFVLFIAGPYHVFLAWLQRRAHGVQTRHEKFIRTQQVQYRTADARHDAHTRHHVG